MATNPQDRLGRLFASSTLPAPSASEKPHFSEVELADKKAKDEAPWRVPEVAQYPRKIKLTQPQQPQRGHDPLTSSDDDDYTSAFAEKPSMRTQARAKPRKMPEPTATGYPEGAVETKGPIKYLARGKRSSDSPPKEQPDDAGDLPPADTNGNPVTGRFCHFGLAAKFPYKYMNDPNDRVSRHFFAANKFYSRPWDL
jgi:hypothetical protein